MKWLLFLFLTGFSQKGFAQSKDSLLHRARYDERRISLLTGLSIGSYSYADIGISLNQFALIGPHPQANACFISNEVRLDKKTIIGPKIGAWISGGASAMAIGTDLIYYTDFKEGSLIFRPEIGFGVYEVKVVYGYNAHLVNKSFEGINRHLVALTYCIRIKKLHRKEETN